MKKIGIILIAVCALALTACHPKETALDELRDFGTKMDANCAKWSRFDWDDNLQLYDELQQTVRQYEYTAEEEAEIDSITFVCAKRFLLHASEKSKDRLNNDGAKKEGLKRMW